MNEYQNLFLQINRVNDPSSLTEMEKKHLPLLKLPSAIKAGEPFTLEVRVGQVQHPMENDHYIQFVDLFVGEVYLARLTFTPVVMLPQAKLTIILKGSGTLRAVSRCNLHGLWESSQPLIISEETPPPKTSS